MYLSEQMLVINGIALPKVAGDNYRCNYIAQEKTKEAIDGTLIREWRGTRCEIEYCIDYMGNEKMRELLTALRSGRVLTVEYLPDDSDIPETGEFICTKYPEPTAAFARGGVLLWHNISFTLQSVKVVTE